MRVAAPSDAERVAQCHRIAQCYRLEPGNWRKPAILLPIALALFALLLRLHALAGKPFWYDEILGVKRASLPLGALVVDALTHKHYPTYFLLLHLLPRAHVDEWTARFPSAVFGAACVLLVSRISFSIGGRLAAVVAGLLMALSPLEVQFGQEARPYALVSCLVLIAVWGLVRVAQEPHAAALGLTAPGALRGPWACYLFGTTAALLVENNAIPWLVASNLAFAAIAHRARPVGGGLRRNWILVQAAVALVWLPALAIMFAVNRGAVRTGLEWVPKSTLQNIRAAAEALYMFRISDMMTFDLLPGPLPQFGIAVAVLALYGAWRLKAQPGVLAVVTLAFVAMPLAVLLISIFQPLLVPRYLLWSTGPYFVMAGVGAARLPPRLAPAIATAAAVGGAISLWPYYRAETKPRWDQVAAYLASNASAQDVVVAEYPSVETIIKFYAEPFQLQSKFDILAWRAHRRPTEVADGSRRFVLYGRVGQGEQESEQEFRRKWSVLGQPVVQARFGTHILVLRFDRPASPPASTPPQHNINSAHLEPGEGLTPRNRAMP